MRRSPQLRRPIPAWITVSRAERNGRRVFERSADERRRALGAMEAILAGTERATHAQRLAREFVIEDHVRDALFWGPWRAPEMDRESRENLLQTMACGRGVLLSRCHQGPIFLGAGAIQAQGIAPYSVAGPWLFEEPASGAWARRVDRWRRGVERMGERLISSTGSFEAIAGLLKQGELVQLYFDMPGSLRTIFLGKPVMLASGTARLAQHTGALVLPMHLGRAGHRISAHVEPALDPLEHSGFEGLQEALAKVHSRAILRAPAMLEDPNRAGAWEQGASAREWVKPGATPIRRSAPTRSLQRERLQHPRAEGATAKRLS